tara:strand:- start:529 stop:858 length:330 start_codon:yes stop_codon:yes gene_type:complete
MDLKCVTCYFYNNGLYKTISELSPSGWFTDIKKVEPSIRIFGTKDQIDHALHDYMALTGLNLDELFDFKEESKKSYFYNKEINKSIKERLKQYKELYEKNNNKALITTI